MRDTRLAELARTMRRAPTRTEFLLWQKLRCKRRGFKFRRQKVVDGYILDFYCHAAKLGIEIDGRQHDPKRDAWRDSVIQHRGIVVMRFTNDEVLRDGLAVVAKIDMQLAAVAATRGESCKSGAGRGL